MRGLWIVLMSLVCVGYLPASEVKELVMFPFSLASGVQQPEEFNVGAETLNALYAKLKDTPGVYVTRFRPTNPSVVRALEENRLRRDRINPPFNEREADGTWRSARIGAVMGADLVLSGAVAEVRYDPRRRTAVITLSVELVQVADNAVLVSVVESGSGQLEGDESDPNLAYIRAVDNVTARIAQVLSERLQPPAAVPQPAQEEKRKVNRRSQEGTLVGLFTLLLGVGARLMGF